MAGDGTVFIGQLLTYKDAIFRLKSGYDIFAINEEKSRMLAKIASPVKKEKGPEIHRGVGIRYYHYHPVGVEWYLNRNHYPHVWFL